MSGLPEAGQYLPPTLHVPMAPSLFTETLGGYVQLTSATVRMKYMDGCWGSMPSSFMPSLKPFLLWVTAWDCQCRVKRTQLPSSLIFA